MSRGLAVRLALAAAAVALAVLLPHLLDDFWLQPALFAASAAIGALGYNLLLGSAGVFSLAPTFFLASGAYLYAFFAGHQIARGDGVTLAGLGLPPLLAVLLALVITGALGLCLSPLTFRLQHLALSVATLGMVFVTQHIVDNAVALTGGPNGRSVPTLSVFGWQVTSLSARWYVALVVLVVAWLYARNVLATRPGRALQAVRDNEIAAAVLGINVRHYRARVFVVSSIYLGACGILLALAFAYIVPDYFDLFLMVSYLSMLVIGGLGSTGGAVLGAAFVTFLPQLFGQYGKSLPLLSPDGTTTGGLSPQEASTILFGVAITAFLLLEPRGFVGIGNRLRQRAATTSKVSE